MKANALRKPLINTAVVLVFFIVLLSISIANPATTALGSFGLIILAGLRALQLFVGLSVALIFCLAFLFAIFFGAVALANPDTAARMYGEFRQTLAAWLGEIIPACKKKTQQHVDLEPMRQELKQELQADLAAIQTQLHATRELLGGKIEQLSHRIDVLETMTAQMANTGEVEALSKEVKGAVASLAGIEGAVNSMKVCVEQTAQQILQMSPEKVLGDVPERLRTLEQQQPKVIDITPLEKDIAVMQQELASVREKADKVLLAAAPETVLVQEPVLNAVAEEPEQVAAQQAEVQTGSAGEEHRILSYFDNHADKQKFIELAEAALEKGLNHKQVIDYLVRGLGQQKGKIISSHPSLIKDYIKSCRRND
ncbi:hypothetical protein VU08_07470 [Desulfobulbus sp. F5]|nr:hypothetical protein [Desulfobulbus sp. F5]